VEQIQLSFHEPGQHLASASDESRKIQKSISDQTWRHGQAFNNNWDLRKDEEQVPSGKLAKNYGKSQFLIGKSTINGPFSIAMLNYQRVNINIYQHQLSTAAGKLVPNSPWLMISNLGLVPNI